MTDGQGPGVCCPKHKPNLVEYIKYSAIRLIDLTDIKALWAALSAKVHL
jgi:hypothetical protein